MKKYNLWNASCEKTGVGNRIFRNKKTQPELIRAVGILRFFCPSKNNLYGFAQDNFEVVMMLDSSIGGFAGLAYPIAFQQFFGRDSDLESYFLSLPEDAQKAIIEEEIRSENDLRECIERYKLKQ